MQTWQEMTTVLTCTRTRAYAHTRAHTRETPVGGTCFKLPQAGPQRRGCKQPDTCEWDDVFLMIPPYF